MNETTPSPSRIFSTLNAYQQTAALKTAIDLDLFTAIAAGADTPAALAQRIGAAERGARILCDYLTVGGLLEKQGDHYWIKQELAPFLDRKSNAYIGSIVEFLGHPNLMRYFERLPEAVQKGGTALEAGGTIEPENPLWVNFAESMAVLAVPVAEFIAGLLKVDNAGPMKVLDIAAGHGTYGITIAQRNPEAVVFAVDWNAVLEVALENARRAGVDARFHEISGSAFEVEFGTGYDVVLFTNFFHHFDMAACVQLMKKARAALKPGGRAVTLEFVPADDRVTPPEQAAFALIMLATTPAGDAYTLAEYRRMFEEASFPQSDAYPAPGNLQTVIVST